MHDKLICGSHVLLYLALTTDGQLEIFVLCRVSSELIRGANSAHGLSNLSGLGTYSGSSVMNTSPPGWLMTDYRRTCFAAILLSKIIQMDEPGYLAVFFKKYQSGGDGKELAILGDGLSGSSWPGELASGIHSRLVCAGLCHIPEEIEIAIPQ